jgi:hypothetical protein
MGTVWRDDYNGVFAGVSAKDLQAGWALGEEIVWCSRCPPFPVSSE